MIVDVGFRKYSYDQAAVRTELRARHREMVQAYADMALLMTIDERESLLRHINNYERLIRTVGGSVNR